MNRWAPALLRHLEKLVRLNEKLLKLGYEPKGDMEGTVRDMLTDLLCVKDRIQKYSKAIEPKILW